MVDAFRKLMLRAAERGGVVLSGAHLESLETHHRLLQAWGRRANLTAIRSLQETIDRHFMEGLLAGQFLSSEGAGGTLLDLGSGNGFPALPIRITCPAVGPLILVESSKKRAAFLRALVRELDWKDCRVEVRRVKSGSDLLDLPCDLFTTRGVVPFPFLAEGLTFLRAGGVALLFMRRTTLEEKVPHLPKNLVVSAEAALPGRETGLILLRKGVESSPK